MISGNRAQKLSTLLNQYKEINRLDDRVKTNNRLALTINDDTISIYKANSLIMNDQIILKYEFNPIDSINNIIGKEITCER